MIHRNVKMGRVRNWPANPTKKHGPDQKVWPTTRDNSTLKSVDPSDEPANQNGQIRGPYKLMNKKKHVQCSMYEVFYSNLNIIIHKKVLFVGLWDYWLSTAILWMYMSWTLIWTVANQIILFHFHIYQCFFLQTQFI